MNAEVRAMKTDAEKALAAAYETARGKLPGLASVRADAFKQFETQGLPHRRVEEWKYTDLRALMREAFPIAAPPDAAAKAHAKAAGDIFSGVDCRRLKFVDGVLAPELSDLKPEPGLTLGSMAQALAAGDALVAARSDPRLRLPAGDRGGRWRRRRAQHVVRLRHRRQNGADPRAAGAGGARAGA